MNNETLLSRCLQVSALPDNCMPITVDTLCTYLQVLTLVPHYCTRQAKLYQEELLVIVTYNAVITKPCIYIPVDLIIEN